MDGQFSETPFKQPQVEPPPAPPSIDGKGVYVSWRSIVIFLVVVCTLVVVWRLRENHHTNVLNEAVQRARQQEAERIFDVLNRNR